MDGISMNMDDFEREIEKAKKAMGTPKGQRGKAWSINGKLARHLIKRCHYSKQQVANYMGVSTYTVDRAIQIVEQQEAEDKQRGRGK